jgi:hypothetical protein
MVENNEVLEEEVYSYQVNTRMPIVGLSVGTLKVPATMKLTKEDVLICVKKAPVFRRFSASDRERVGIGNIDRLHRAEHLTEEEYEAMIDKNNDNRGKVSESQVEEKKETPVVKEEPKVEAPVIEEIKVEEPVVEESTPVVEEKPEATEEVNEVEEVSEDVTEDSTEVETESAEENNKNNSYYNKKKHRR